MKFTLTFLTVALTALQATALPQDQQNQEKDTEPLNPLSAAGELPGGGNSAESGLLPNKAEYNIMKQFGETESNLLAAGIAGGSIMTSWGLFKLGNKAWGSWKAKKQRAKEDAYDEYVKTQLVPIFMEHLTHSTKTKINSEPVTSWVKKPETCTLYNLSLTAENAENKPAEGKEMCGLNEYLLPEELEALVQSQLGQYLKVSYEPQLRAIFQRRMDSVRNTLKRPEAFEELRGQLQRSAAVANIIQDIKKHTLQQRKDEEKHSDYNYSHYREELDDIDYIYKYIETTYLRSPEATAEDKSIPENVWRKLIRRELRTNGEHRDAILNFGTWVYDTQDQ